MRFKTKVLYFNFSNWFQWLRVIDQTNYFGLLIIAFCLTLIGCAENRQSGLTRPTEIGEVQPTGGLYTPSTPERIFGPKEERSVHSPAQPKPSQRSEDDETDNEMDAPDSETHSSQKNRPTAISSPYIVLGEKEEFVRLQNQVFSKINLNLADKIQFVSVQKLDQNYQPSDFIPRYLKVFVSLKSLGSLPARTAEFFLVLKTDAKQSIHSDNDNTLSLTPLGPVASATFELGFDKKERSLQVQTECRDVNCNKIDFLFSAWEGLGPSRKMQPGTVGVFFKKSKPKVTLRKPLLAEASVSTTASADEDSLSKLISGPHCIEQSSMAVVGGASRTRLDIYSPTCHGQPARTIELPVVDTSITGGFSETGSEELIGADPETGAILVEVSAVNDPIITQTQSIESSENFAAANERATTPTPVSPTPPATVTSASAASTPSPSPSPSPQQPIATNRFILEVSQDNTDRAEVPQSELEASLHRGLFKTPRENERAYRQSLSFARLSRDEDVQSLIRSNSGIREKAAGAHRHTYRVSPLISEVFLSYNLSPEFAYMMLVETDRFHTGQYNGDTSECGADSFGFWQMKTATAKSFASRNLPFSIFPVSGCDKYRNLRFNNLDDRLYITQSTMLAAMYLDKLLKTYGFDFEPIVAIMGYNRGDSYPQILRSNFARAHREYSLSFRDLKRFNFSTGIRQKNHKRAIDYANKFLAYRDLGQNYHLHGFSSPPEPRLDTSIPYLHRPGGPVPPGFNQNLLQQLTTGSRP